MKFFRFIYNASDWLLNLQPFRNQVVEIYIFGFLFVFSSVFFLFTLDLLYIFVSSILLWIFVTLMYANDQMDKYRDKLQENEKIDNCATNFYTVIKQARHYDDDCIALRSEQCENKHECKLED